ncbi:Glutamate--tRNA ligase 1 [Botrimarina colliarenosi]|uniref:Glutamate--tRNA ligase n=1 Tax=Botrimarina colliarenosi TaxID=2528001 RepID=A0A5C6AIE9_9BACT|nr:glutamate--tRNA ligase [Botrimarina colliarenosi]TWT99166.1 Glutamate--tRNA ligase 1 [Botrimarina colliarenosi]
MTVRTRFAPSPTGFLHIGGVRTALFNWLYARQHGGQFLLRVDDTDQQRNVEEALAPILHGFEWLGLDWDEGPVSSVAEGAGDKQSKGDFGPYFQSQRGEHYAAAVDQLLASGAAYRDYARPEEVQAEREAAEKAKESFVYSRQWRAETDADRARFEAEGREAVVRLLMPREGTLVLNDLVRGEVRFDWAREQDHVIQRADGSPIYHLATVVDDELMKISHVIRAEEHLSNTPRQVFIAEALGYTPPQFAHLPYVAEPGSKNKLSKRKLDKYLKNRDFAALNEKGQQIAARLGLETSAETFNPVIVDFYEQVGFLPEAILNYLLLLGWSLDDSREEFTVPEMIEHFSLGRVNKAPASFDPAKLLAFQDRAMQQVPAKQKTPRCLEMLKAAGLVSDPPACDTGPVVAGIVQAASDRLKVYGDILDYDDFFTADDQLAYDEKTWQKRMVKPDDAGPLLAKYREVLAKTPDASAEELEAGLKAFCESEGIGIGQIIHALRVATTGKGVGFGMFETLQLLGHERRLARIDHALARLSG